MDIIIDKNVENFLEQLSKEFAISEEETILFEKEFSGAKHPETIKILSVTISLLYKGACCFWQCNGGDHLIERMIAKSVNQAISAFKLYRGCFYDESLMITRGIGEIANLLHLFCLFPEKIEQWKTQNDRERYNNFKPAKVRYMLEEANHLAMIDKVRYSRLCEVGTHPTPSEVPGHYTGTGVPILGMIVQPVGAYVSITELSYAVGLVSVAAPKLLKLPNTVSEELRNIGISLIKTLGNFHILNYNELLEKAWENTSEKKLKA
jgi:hypothetical protein